MGQRRKLTLDDWEEGALPQVSENVRWLSRSRNISLDEAREQVGRARQYLSDNALPDQSDEDRTWALRTLGLIGTDEFYRDGYLVTADEEVS